MPYFLKTQLVSQAAEQRSLERVSGFQQSLEAESEGILLVDTSTPDWNILFQNEAWLRITGMTREEVYGGKMWHLFMPAGQTRVGTTSIVPQWEHCIVSQTTIQDQLARFAFDLVCTPDMIQGIHQALLIRASLGSCF